MLRLLLLQSPASGKHQLAPCGRPLTKLDERKGRGPAGGLDVNGPDAAVLRRATRAGRAGGEEWGGPSPRARTPRTPHPCCTRKAARSHAATASPHLGKDVLQLPLTDVQRQVSNVDARGHGCCRRWAVRFWENGGGECVIGCAGVLFAQDAQCVRVCAHARTHASMRASSVCCVRA